MKIRTYLKSKLNFLVNKKSKVSSTINPYNWDVKNNRDAMFITNFDYLLEITNKNLTKRYSLTPEIAK